MTEYLTQAIEMQSYQFFIGASVVIFVSVIAGIIIGYSSRP